MADYVYSANQDTQRVRIFARAPGSWDFDLFTKSEGYLWAFTAEFGESPFATKRAAKEYACKLYGPLIACGRIATVTEGWSVVSGG